MSCDQFYTYIYIILRSVYLVYQYVNNSKPLSRKIEISVSNIIKFGFLWILLLESQTNRLALFSIQQTDMTSFSK
jgi:hypothetical protein